MMNLTSITAMCALFGVCADAALAAEPFDKQQLQEALESQLVQVRAPGALVGVYRSEQEPLTFAVGLADVDQQRPMTTDCSFRIASLSKVLVGTTLLIVADEAEISLDEPIARFVSGVPHGERISLRDLGSHRSGLFNHIESRQVKDLFAADPERWWSKEELLQFSLQAPTYFEPGTEHHYANSNTVLMAVVIEKLTGKPWAEAVTQRVIRPLGLSHTVIPTDNSLPTPHAEGYAWGQEQGAFFFRGDVLHRVTDTSPSWWGPAGSMISTLEDVGRMAKPLATGQLLSEKMRQELLSWTPADQAGFEYGFHIERTQGRIGHDGDVPGFQTVMRYFPEADVTVVAMCNLYGWSVRGMPANQMAEVVIDQLLHDATD